MGIWRRRKRLLELPVLLALAMPAAADDDGKWIEIRDCRLIAHAANDGDSFHVRGGGREYLVRLYFVDAPEHSRQVPERVREQADWFGTTEEQILQQGALAATRVAEWLDRPFTIHTQLIDARGASSMQRVFAMVEVGDRYLCELLVEHGLARIHGIRRNLDDGTFRWDHVRKLEALEAKAKAAGSGLWGDGKSSPAAKVLRRITLARDVQFFTAAAMPTFRGMLKKGDIVEVLSEAPGLVAVRAPFRGKTEPGHCRRQDLVGQ